MVGNGEGPHQWAEGLGLRSEGPGGGVAGGTGSQGEMTSNGHQRAR
ncbi:MAG: hypothetical protein QOF51_4293 [Chloroflexota bacterium]|nr:hypothetical protein [Chloroflexota bacterium]